MATLPDPKVDIVTTDDGADHVVISRGGPARSHKIEGATEKEKIKSTVEKVLKDRYTGEFLP